MPLVRVPRTLPRLPAPQEADQLISALRTHGVRTMLRRCEVLGLWFDEVQVPDRRLVVAEGKAAVTGCAGLLPAL